jgi:HEAT repeat protein
VSAFERQPIGKETKKVLALAAAATRAPSAGTALVNALLHPRAREIRIEVGEALRRLASPDAVAFLVQQLEVATPEQAVNLLNALGTAAPDSVAAAEAARRHVLHPQPAVRIEAAHALGLIARVRFRENPVAELDGRPALMTALSRAGSENEQLAAVWALAQFDEPEAYAALRQLATHDDRPLVRRAAERYLANPRLSLVLR